MKSFTLVTAFLFVCIVAISQVWAASAEPMEEAEGIAHNVRTEEPQATPEACAPTMNVEQAHHNLMMAVCEQMQPGFIHNMMETGDRHMMQHLDRRDTDSEAYTAQFFPPFPPFPPPPTFPPFPPFPPGTGGGRGGRGRQ